MESVNKRNKNYKKINEKVGVIHCLCLKNLKYFKGTINIPKHSPSSLPSFLW